MGYDGDTNLKKPLYIGMKSNLLRDATWIPIWANCNDPTAPSGIVVEKRNHKRNWP